MTAVGRPLVTARSAAAPVTLLRWPDALPAVIAVLMAFASLGGLFLPGLYRDNTWATAAFRGNDLATLVLAVPVLAVALVLASRGSERARLVWFAVLAYNVYNSACRTNPDVSRIARWSVLRARCISSLPSSRRPEPASHEPEHVESRNMRRRSVYATG
jgi:hypothetical protein